MIQIDNIQYRNLTEQVLKNTELLNLLPHGLSGTSFKGIYEDIYLAQAAGLNDRDIVLVGEAAPYILYIKYDGQLKNLGAIPQPGPQGIPGIQGEPGPKGADGIGWRTGSGKPTLQSIEGELYLDYASGDIYEYTTSRWVLKTNIKGPQGIQGNRGLQGPSGPTGPQGNQGPQGTPGASYVIEGKVNSVDELPSATRYMAYLVGNSLYISINGSWVDTGAILPAGPSVVNTLGASETAATSQKLVTDTVNRIDTDIEEKTRILNPNNLIANATFESTIYPTGTGGEVWTYVSNVANLYTEVKDNGFPAKAVYLSYPASGQAGGVRQVIRNLTSGQYTFNLLALSPNEYLEGTSTAANINFRFRGYTSGGGTEYITPTTYSYQLPLTFDFDATRYTALELTIQGYLGASVKGFTEPILVSGSEAQPFYVDKWWGPIEASHKVPDLESDVEVLKDNIGVAAYLNTDNLIDDAKLTNDSTYWDTAITGVEIIETGLPANIAKFTNAGSAAQLRRIERRLDKFPSGQYYCSLRWLTGQEGFFRIRGYNNSTATYTTLVTVFSSTSEEEKVFTLDSSLFTALDIMIQLGNVTTVEVTEPILVQADKSHSFYKDPFTATFDAVLKVQELEQSGTVSKLFGKILASNGDSIAAGAGFTGGYTKLIAEANSMVYQNVAVGGGTIVPQDGYYSIVGGMDSLRADADYVILEGGVNDTYRLEAGTIALGEVGPDYRTNYDLSTYCNAFQKMLYTAYTKYPGKKILYVSPHNHSNWKPGNAIYDASIAMCEKWGIPVCDLTTSTAPLGRIANYKTLYTKDGDGQHPNEAGYRAYYVERIQSALESI